MLQYRLVQKTRVLEGMNSIQLLPRVCRENGFSKPFLVFDQGVSKAGIPGRIMDILAEEWGIDVADITKAGGHSRVIAGLVKDRI